MNWLNKIDDVLEYSLSSATKQVEDDEISLGSDSSNEDARRPRNRTPRSLTRQPGSLQKKRRTVKKGKVNDSNVKEEKVDEQAPPSKSTVVEQAPTSQGSLPATPSRLSSLPRRRKRRSMDELDESSEEEEEERAVDSLSVGEIAVEKASPQRSPISRLSYPESVTRQAKPLHDIYGNNSNGTSQQGTDLSSQTNEPKPTDPVAPEVLGPDTMPTAIYSEDEMQSVDLESHPSQTNGHSQPPEAILNLLDEIDSLSPVQTPQRNAAVESPPMITRNGSDLDSVAFQRQKNVSTPVSDPPFKQEVVRNQAVKFQDPLEEKIEASPDRPSRPRSNTDNTADSFFANAADFRVAKVLGDLPSPRGFDARRCNRRGTVNVRLLRAQRLSCSVGSNVYADVYLRPWKGKIRTNSTTAFSGPKDENGVCTEWDETENDMMSMVHDYTSEDSPVPTLFVDLRFSLGLLGLSIATFTLNLHQVLYDPSVAQRGWFGASKGDPLLEVEVTFNPTPLARSTPAPTTGDSASPVKTNGLNDTTRFDPAGSPVVVPKKRHLLQLQTHRLPAFCGVCGKSIISGLFSKTESYRCVQCNVDCCSDCRVQVDLRLPCGSEDARESIKQSFHSFSLKQIARVVAPVNDDTEHIKPRLLSQEKSSQNVPCMATLRVEVHRAFVFSRSVSPEDFSENMKEQPKVSFQVGDYYVRLEQHGTDISHRTPIVQQTGRPTFDAHTFNFPV